jgi:hypothetical protein
LAELSQQIGDDGAHGFLASRALTGQAATDAWWQSMLQQAKTPPPVSQPVQPPAPAPPAEMPLGQRLINAPFTTLGQVAGTVVSDIGRGLVDAPRQILGGSLDFINNIWKFSDSLVKHAEEAGVPNVYFRLFDENGKWAPGIESEEAFRKAQEEGKEHILQVPTTGSPETMTGNLIRAATPFLLGRGTTGGAVSQLPNIARDVISGTIATDPSQQRLSNLIDSVAPNFLTRFLEAKPGDEDTLLGHLKSGLEYGGYGALVQGAIASARALKGLVGGGEAAPEAAAVQPEGARPAAETPAVPRETAAAAPPRDVLRIGDPLAPAVEIRPGPREAAMAEVTAGRLAGEAQPIVTPGVEAAEPIIMSEQTIHDYLAGARVDNPVNINLERIGSSEDINDALKQVSRTIPAQAVQSNEATIALSDALGLQPAALIKGYQGAQLDAAETTAMRFMLDSSAAQLIKYGEVARDPLASPEAKAQFLKAFTTHRALQSYAENARAEAGRTLQAWSIMSQQRTNYAQAIDALVRQAEGTQGDLSGLAEKVAALTPLQAGRYVAGSMAPRDRLLTAWYNALLSSPTTVVKKAISDIGMATWNVATTQLAEKFGQSVPEGETGSLVSGYVSGFKDAVRAGGKALRAGESQFYKDYATWEGTSIGDPADAAMQRFKLSAALNGAPDILSDAEPTRAAYEYIRPFFPTSWIAGVDDFAKVWNYRGELSRLSWRAAEGDSETYARLMDNPDPMISTRAVNAALKTTFQEPIPPSGIGAGIRNIADASVQIPHTNFELPIGRMLIPFTKVPYNIARTAAENSPLGFLMRPVQAQLRAGGAARDLALARIGLGSGISLAFSDLALNNYIAGRGPSDPSLKREWLAAGNQPYSLQIPGLRPVALNQIEPFGMTFGAIADTFNILKFAEDEKDFGTLLPSLALGIGNAMLSKTYFEGMARFIDAVTNPQQQGNRWAEGFLTGFEPQLLSRIGRSMDDWERAHYGYLDSLEERLPWLRQNLPPQRTLWGDPVPVREGFAPLLPSPAARVVSPLALGPDPEKVEPIDKWIWDNRAAFPLQASGDPRGIQKAARTQVFRSGAAALSVELNPKTYDHFIEMAGNGLKDPATGLGAKDLLNALVEARGPRTEQRSWDNATPEARALAVVSVVDRYRNAAREQLLADDHELAEMVTEGLKTRAGALTGQPMR